MTDLAARVQALESIEAIKMLKHRYLRACDEKDPEAFRACFVTKGAVVDYGPRVGTFDDADALTQAYRAMALRREDGRFVVLDMHHGLHPVIELQSQTAATGQWTLRFRQVDLSDRTEQVSAIEYEDDYLLEDGQWRISRCRVRVLWTMVGPLDPAVRIVQGYS